MRHILPVVVCLLFLHTAFSQVSIEADKNSFFASTDSQKLAIGLSNRNFFKNNEYFSTLHEGYTLIGFQAEPTLIYFPGPTTRIEAGANLLKYYGRDGIYRIEPIFRFQYQPLAWFQTILGTIYGGTNHGLIEPMYQWEKSFTDPLENGVQFLVNAKTVKADVWLNWEKFILANDPFQEELTFGTTIDWNLFPTKGTVGISIPFQTLINHQGGQIISVDKPLRTLVNYATGIKATMKPGTDRVKEVNIQLWYLGFNDLSPQKLQAFQQGFAIYPRMEALVSNFIFQAGYFTGNMFIAPKGESLFHNAHIPFSVEKRSTSDLVTGKIAYRKIIGKGLSFSAYLETYTNLGFSQTDYCYGLHLAMNREFFIRSFGKSIQ